MRAYFIIANLLLPLCAFAGVYRWIDPSGQIHYSDRPQIGSEWVSVPGHRRAPAANNDAPGEESDTTFGPYSAFEILRPEPSQTLRDADAKVELSLLIDPPLSEDHHVQILLDDQAVPGNTRQTQMLLRDLSYGSHRLQVQIRDDLNAIIASSPAVNFHLLKPVP